MEENLIIWDWKPLLSVGPIYFGDPVKKLVENQGLKLMDFDDGITEWDTYQVPNGETTVHVEDGKVVSVGCYENLYFNGKNLLGLTLDTVRTILGKEDEIGEEIIDKTPVEYERLGLQIWIRNEIVVDAICYSPIEGD
jgi:hypothetical protein